MFVRPSRSLRVAHLGQSRPVADEEEDDVGAVAEPSRGLQELVEAMRQAEVARVHRDELVRHPERLAERVPVAREGIDLVAAAPDGDRDHAVGADPLGHDPVGHVGAEDHHRVGLAVDEVAQPLQPGDDRVAGRHPPQRQAGVGVQVHAPVDVPRPLEPAEQRADQADDRRRRQGGDHVEPGQGRASARALA